MDHGEAGNMIAHLLFTVLAAAQQTPTPEQQLCDLRPTAAAHAGQVFQFRGGYGSDGRERARLDIEGCHDRYGVGGFADGVPELMDPENPSAAYMLPARRITALFTVRIDVVRPNTAQFQGDDGVRLTILAVSEIEPIPR